MKKYLIGISIVVVLGLIIAVLLPFLYTQDDRNKIARKSVELLDGNYTVTYSNGPTVRTWTVINGKVTSTDKGYYFFWDNKNPYVQVPVTTTVIEAY